MANREEWKDMRLNWKRFGIGLGISVLMMLSMTAAGAALISQEIVSWDWANYLAALILTVTSFVGGTIIGGRSALAEVLILAGAYWLVLLGIHGIVFGGEVRGAGETALAILGGCGTSLLIGKQRGKRRSRKGRKHTYR